MLEGGFSGVDGPNAMYLYNLFVLLQPLGFSERVDGKDVFVCPYEARCPDKKRTGKCQLETEAALWDHLNSFLQSGLELKVSIALQGLCM